MKRTLLLIFALVATFPLWAQQLTVGSYNIRCLSAQDDAQGNGWAVRCPHVTSLIEYHDFDILGVQEVTHSQLVDMTSALTDYAYVGVGRTDGKQKGEYSPIFYRKSRFAVEEWGNMWLSQTPDRPSTGWDAKYPRICTWALLKDAKTKSKVWYFNLHMDHVGVEARRQSAHQVLAAIKSMCCKDDYIVWTGDFNVDQNNEIFAIMASDGVVDDSYSKAAVRYAPAGTINHFDAARHTESRIDHVFVSKPFKVVSYGVLTDTYRTPIAESTALAKTDNFPKEVDFQKYEVRLPSDHYPVRVVLDYGAESKSGRCNSCGNHLRNK